MDQNLPAVFLQIGVTSTGFANHKCSKPFELCKLALKNAGFRGLRLCSERLSIEYNVDFQVKKLNGQTMFQLLLFSMLNTKDNSLRVMEEFYHSLAFKNIAKSSFEDVKYNSIRDRLVNIKSDYFEAVFKNCLDKFQEKYLKKKNNIISFDSTLVSISSKLLEDGMIINKKGDKKYVKFSVAFSSIPIHSKVFTEQSFVSEGIVR